VSTIDVHVDPAKGWTDEHDRPLSADDAEALGLDPTMRTLTLDTPSGPVDFPEYGVVRFAQKGARWVALLVRLGCEGCGRPLDTPLRDRGAGGSPLPPAWRRRCATCGPSPAARIQEGGSGADPATGNT
jgi:hypothetical protein